MEEHDSYEVFQETDEYQLSKQQFQFVKKFAVDCYLSLGRGDIVEQMSTIGSPKFIELIKNHYEFLLGLELTGYFTEEETEYDKIEHLD